MKTYNYKVGQIVCWLEDDDDRLITTPMRLYDADEVDTLIKKLEEKNSD